MAVMTAQPPLPMAPVAGAIPVGGAAALIEDGDGGRVFVHGVLVYAWAVEDVALRRLAAVQLVERKVAAVSQVCAAFAVSTVTLWRCGKRWAGRAWPGWSRANGALRAPPG